MRKLIGALILVLIGCENNQTPYSSRVVTAKEIGTDGVVLWAGEYWCQRGTLATNTTVIDLAAARVGEPFGCRWQPPIRAEATR